MVRLTLYELLFKGRKFRLARIWSNRVLAEIAGLFEGDIINVSAWEDDDKEGSKYRSYFRNAKSYSISNYGGERGKAEKEDYSINLEADLPEALKMKFDVVFNHTTLEHVFDLFRAVRNLCELSRDVVIVVVPFVQETHTLSSFSDYWRFTHFGLERLFKENGFEVIYLTSTPYPNTSIYHFCVASRQPGVWRQKLKAYPGATNPGDKVIADNMIWRLLSLLRGGRGD